MTYCRCMRKKRMGILVLEQSLLKCSAHLSSVGYYIIHTKFLHLRLGYTWETDIFNSTLIFLRLGVQEFYFEKYCPRGKQIQIIFFYLKLGAWGMQVCEDQNGISDNPEVIFLLFFCSNWFTVSVSRSLAQVFIWSELARFRNVFGQVKRNGPSIW